MAHGDSVVALRHVIAFPRTTEHSVAHLPRVCAVFMFRLFPLRYYFNHLMAIQMTGGADQVVIGETDANLIPDMAWLQKQFDAQRQQQQQKRGSSSDGSIKLVVIVNPGNPSGTIVPRAILEKTAAMCAKHDAWLVRAPCAHKRRCPLPPGCWAVFWQLELVVFAEC